MAGVTGGQSSVSTNRKPGPGKLVAPTLEHPHSEARSLTGGIVYRGQKFPELVGPISMETIPLATSGRSNMMASKSSGTNILRVRSCRSLALDQTLT